MIDYKTTLGTTAAAIAQLREGKYLIDPSERSTEAAHIRGVACAISVAYEKEYREVHEDLVTTMIDIIEEIQKA